MLTCLESLSRYNNESKSSRNLCYCIISFIVLDAGPDHVRADEKPVRPGRHRRVDPSLGIPWSQTRLYIWHSCSNVSQRHQGLVGAERNIGPGELQHQELGGLDQDD